MSHITNALDRLFGYVSDRMDKAAPFRAVVSGTSGNRVLIHRPEAVTADAEPYAKATFDTFTNGDEVLCLPVNGKPVVLGRTNPTGNVPHTHDDRYYTETEVTALIGRWRTRSALPVRNDGTLTISTSGDYDLVSTSVSGLTPGAEYDLILMGVTRAYATSSTSAAILWGKVNGTLQGVNYLGLGANAASGWQLTTPLHCSIRHTANGSGVANVAFTATWQSGTMAFTNREMTAIAVPV